ncbi:MAG: SUMF1/EgtB/PvdO family nonheme iron enzyme [Magnetococcales bacterium]|nr:SUMF1/EgtB/PvdO family nonheme iron enzyme [Magnetococcales bacterium]MBF0423374.1 SUMF1/EgtB/PvdO family nonheme iron enzyme [Magnetococcales bacterium]
MNRNVHRLEGISLLKKWHREELHNRISVNVKDGSVMVYIPAGEFEMGDGEDTDCPKHVVNVSGYWIGVYAVTNGQYLKFVRESGHRPPGNTHWKEVAKADHPVVDVSWEDAVAYATWSECRLPTEAEWEKAARGPLGLKYPWGDEFDGSRCRYNGNRGNETTCPVYGYGEGVSGYGLYNSSGNVWEWVSDWYDGNFYANSPRGNPQGPNSGSDRVLRGGGWDGTPANVRSAYRGRNDPGFRGNGLGFRLSRTYP